MNFKCEIVQSRGVDGISIERERQAYQSITFCYVMKLSLGDLGRHAFQWAYIYHAIDLALPPFAKRRANGQDRLAFQRGGHIWPCGFYHCSDIGRRSPAEMMSQG